MALSHEQVTEFLSQMGYPATCISPAGDVIGARRVGKFRFERIDISYTTNRPLCAFAFVSVALVPGTTFVKGLGFGRPLLECSSEPGGGSKLETDEDHREWLDLSLSCAEFAFKDLHSRTDDQADRLGWDLVAADDLAQELLKDPNSMLRLEESASGEQKAFAESILQLPIWLLPIRGPYKLAAYGIAVYGSTIKDPDSLMTPTERWVFTCVQWIASRIHDHGWNLHS